MCMGSEMCPMLLMHVCPKSLFWFFLKCQELISQLVEWPVQKKKKKQKNSYTFVFFFFKALKSLQMASLSSP